MKPKLNALHALLPLVMLLFIGCSTISSTNKSIKEYFAKERPKTPARMVSFWQCYAQTDPGGGSPLRGIGGRIIFYEEKKSSDSVKVDGDLTIYLFDANDPIPEKSVPLKFAVFKRDAIPSFYRKDEVGIHGYDFFVPMDAIDGEEKEIQVLAIYKEEKKKGEPNALIYSTPAVVTLLGSRKSENGTSESDESKSDTINDSSGPGSREISLADARDFTENISQASYQSSGVKYGNQISHDNPEQNRRRGESITLPQHYTQAYRTEDWTPPQKQEIPVYNNDAPSNGYYNGYGYYGGSIPHENSSAPQNSRMTPNTMMPSQFSPSFSNRFNEASQGNMPPQFRQNMPPQFRQPTPQQPQQNNTDNLRKEYETTSETGVSTQVFLGPPPGASRK